jgi:hypothetical protein
MKYNICGIEITKEQALKIAQTNYDIHRKFRTGNRTQDEIDIRVSLQTLNNIKQDVAN